MARMDIAFTPAVKEAQRRHGSREGYTKVALARDWSNAITEDFAAFVAERDSIYLGTASADGQPYIQHRGGPKGFVKVIDERHLAFAEYPGNRQYISLGNLSENDRAFMFLMDYENRRRIKVWGTARFVDDDAELLERVLDPGYGETPERVLVFRVEAWDVNCPKHIRPRVASEASPNRRSVP
jgi:predicted pyridoxine 5'-phosphate oxidase superfamily flavin-nucleotide-binding protein